jgi:polyhydroxyalkanoate synthesis repressor PhaR
MPIIIKRYRNRKLYNTDTKRYITLEQIEELIKTLKEVQVIDNDTGDDITAATLSQIIFELEKNQSGFLPLNLLFSLVQSGGNRIDDLRRNVFNSLNLAHHYDVEIERRINQLIDNAELSSDEGALLLKKLLSVSSRREDMLDTIEASIADFMKQRQILTKNDLRALLNKIEDLTKRVEELSGSQANSR